MHTNIVLIIMDEEEYFFVLTTEKLKQENDTLDVLRITEGINKNNQLNQI